MFNVSALLLDDAFKPATPLTNGAINETSLICGSPNSPDLNTVDCAVSGALQHMVYQPRRVTTITQLKQAIVTEWGKLSQRFTDLRGTRRRRRGLVVVKLL